MRNFKNSRKIRKIDNDFPSKFSSKFFKNFTKSIDFLSLLDLRRDKPRRASRNRQETKKEPIARLFFYALTDSVINVGTG